MRAVLLTTLFLAVPWSGSARAECLCPPEWLQRAQALVRSLAAVLLPDRDVIAAPADIDRQMVLTPPLAHGVLRVLPPARPPRQH